MFDHLFELSHRDDSNKWSNIGFGEGITQLESIEVKFYAPYLELLQKIEYLLIVAYLWPQLYKSFHWFNK